MSATLPLQAVHPETAAPETASPARARLAGTRWLHVVSHTDPRYGGLSAAVPALGVTLRERYGVDVALAAFCNPGEEHKPTGYDELHLSFWPASRRAWNPRGTLSRNFREEVRRADGLHIHGLWEKSTALACEVARSLGKPYVLSAHGMLEPWALRNRRLKKLVYAALVERRNVRGAACLHALTAAEAEQYRGFGARGRVTVVPNAVSLPEDVGPDEFLQHFPQLRNKRIVLFLSRLHPKKGLDLLVDAWARVAKDYPDARLVLAGPDSEGMQARLTATLLQHGADHQVVFTGMIAGDLKWSALAAAECFVLPSYSEGLSMALLEAMGSGLPVIATRACNMPEIVAADAGWEIESNAEALTVALTAMLSQTPDENWATGQNGARLVAEQCSQESVVRQMAELYAQVLGMDDAGSAGAATSDGGVQ